MKKVAIMMSTYNGEKYIEEQLNSLENLETQDLKIHVKIRDDGSSDNTTSILERYCQKNKNMTWYQGKNKGPAYSFLELLKNQNGYDYYAFCDQDDVWETQKVKEAIKKIEKFDDTPTMYFSAVDLVDKDLNFIAKKEVDINFSLETSLILTPVIGCTLIINNKLKEIISKVDIKGEIEMHDAWIYRVANFIDAKIICDNNSYIKYRQHENNVVGLKANKTLLEKLSYFITDPKRKIGAVSKNLLKAYKSSASNDKINVLQDIINLSEKHSIKNKLKILRNKNFKSNNINQNIKFYYDVVFNRI